MAAEENVVLITDANRGGDGAPFESSWWARLAHAADTSAFAENWLDIQCRAIDGVVRAVLVLKSSEAGAYAPVALWPSGIQGNQRLAALAEQSLRERVVVVEGVQRNPKRHETVLIAHPVIVDEEPFGTVALELEGRPERSVRDVVQQLGWGVGWLEVLARRKTFTSKARLVTVLQLLATSVSHDRFASAATAVVTELAATFGCERVSLGFMKGRHIAVKALSHSASFTRKMNLIRSLESAMEEAADQLASIVYPARSEETFQVTRAHAELHQQHGAGPICTIPLMVEGRVLGALTLELPVGAEFDRHTVELCEHASLLLGPVLDVKRKEDRWLLSKAVDSLRTLVVHLVGPRHVALKMWVVGIAAVAAFLATAEAPYRITADASLEGQVQRAVTAAMEGYVVEARARAGDVVRKGDVLAALDDRDLRLERQKLESQRGQVQSERRAAIAEGNRARARILESQQAQIDAQAALIDEQIARTRLMAPFDAVVVKGDLSQSLGAAVERGNVLFELAPLESYRVIMKVDERDITDVTVGRPGQLALSSMPNEPLDLVVEKITPVSVVDEGRNYFRVEARAEGLTDKLRPGMEGVGKIEVEQRKLIWIWTHKLVHWVRMWVWSWWP